MRPLLPSTATEDSEPTDDDDLSMITPPPRPAPRAAAFKGLRIIENRTTVMDDDSAAPPSVARARPAPRAPASASPARQSSARRNSGRRSLAPPELAPAQWPANARFAAPEPVARAELPTIPQTPAPPATPPPPAAPPPVPAPPEVPAPPPVLASAPADDPAEILFGESQVRRPPDRTGVPAGPVPGATQARRVKAILFLVPILGLLLVLVVILAGAINLPGHPIPAALMLVTGLAVIGVVAVAATEANRAIPHPLPGAELSRGEHVRLWAAVSVAAHELGVETPMRIVVDGAARAAVSRRPAGNELVIGLPLILGLREPELLAVLIHQMAHDAAPGAALHRLGERIEATNGQLGSDRRWSRRPARVLMGWYGRMYQQLASSSNEQHTVRAGQLAAGLTSAQTLAGAIVAIELIRDRWQILVTRFVPFSAVAGRRPSLRDGLDQLLALPAGPPSTGHPPTHEPPAREPPAHEPPARRSSTGPPASDLLGRGADDLPGLERAILPDDHPAADWDTIVKLAAQAQAQERTGHLAWAMQQQFGSAPVTLSAVLAAIADGDGPQIVTPLMRPGLPAAKRPAAAQRTLEQLLAAFIVTVLLDGGRARHEIAWPDGIRLLRRDAGGWIRWDGDEPIRSGTADPAGGAALRRWLLAINADLQAAAEPSDGPPLLTLSALSDVILLLPFEHRPVDLLIYRTGILLAPIDVPTPAARLTQQATQTLRRQNPASVIANRIVQLAEQAGEAPQDLPNGWWIAFGTVAGSAIRNRRGGREITLRLKDGASVTVRQSSRSTSRGPALDDLVRLLPKVTRR